MEKAGRSAVSTRLASFVPSNGRSHNSTRDLESRIERSVESRTWLQSFLLAWRDAYTRPTDLVRRMSRIDQIHGNDKSIESFPFERSRNRSRRSNICTNRLSSLRKRIFCSCKQTIAKGMVGETLTIANRRENVNSLLSYSMASVFEFLQPERFHLSLCCFFSSTVCRQNSINGYQGYLYIPLKYQYRTFAEEHVLRSSSVFEKRATTISI